MQIGMSSNSAKECLINYINSIYLYISNRGRSQSLHDDLHMHVQTMRRGKAYSGKGGLENMCMGTYGMRLHDFIFTKQYIGGR